MICNLCPRKCGAERSEDGGSGFCRMGSDPVAARAALHKWEEPVISGSRGSGAIFFSGCTLRCLFCQNSEISAEGFGRRFTALRLREIMDELILQGAHNINLVSPTPFIPSILEALKEPLPVPVVWNTGGYELTSSLRAMQGKVDIYLPDMKYVSSELSQKYSGAADYFDYAQTAIFEMYRQVGDCVFGDDGLLKRGVIVRHLVLPGNLKNTFQVIDWFTENFRDKGVYLSLMGQYVPHGRAKDMRPLDRTLTDREYLTAVRYARESGIERGFIQERSAADAAFIPPFDLTGI